MVQPALARTATVITAIAAAACGDDPPVHQTTCESLSIVATAPPSQCGPTLDLTPINSYTGELASAQEREEAVALVGGSCTGTLIAAAAGPVVLTAGHCVGLGDRSLIAFNVEDQADGDPLVTDGTVIERADEPDYALIMLDRLPAAVAPTALTTLTTDLVVAIQHPRGRPKQIGEGSYLDTCGALVVYGELDTLVGSSGAGVLNAQGFLLGIHTDGNCTEDGGGANRGWSAASIVEASAHLAPADLAER